MKRTVALSVFCLGLLLCSSRGTDLFHITADEQIGKFQELFSSLVGQDDESLSKMIACFVVGNDPDGIDQVVVYDHDSFIDSLTTPPSNYDHISIKADKGSLTTKIGFGYRKLIRGFGGKETVQYKSYVVTDSEIVYQCDMAQKNTGARRKVQMQVSMENVYTDEYPDGIITCLYFTNVDQRNGNLSPVNQ